MANEMGRVIVHICAVCRSPKAWFGNGQRVTRGVAGRWFCAAHRDGHKPKEGDVKQGKLF